MPRLKDFRFPRKIIAYAVWAYHRFALSTGDVEDLLAERGVTVSREAIRLWINRFGRHFAECIQRDRPAPRNKWQMDEVVIIIQGKNHWLWRAIDADGSRSIFWCSRVGMRKSQSVFCAGRSPGSVLPGSSSPTSCVAISSRSHALASDADHRAHNGLNNAIEVSHRPSRKREKMFGRFKSPRQAQRFLSAHDQINLIFRPRRHKLSAASYRHARSDAFSLWADYTAEMTG